MVWALGLALDGFSFCVHRRAEVLRVGVVGESQMIFVPWGSKSRHREYTLAKRSIHTVGASTISSTNLRSHVPNTVTLYYETPRNGPNNDAMTSA